MSRRGSFVTSWVICPDCRAALDKFDWSAYDFEVYPLALDLGERPPPIIAGKFKGNFNPAEGLKFRLSPLLCHRVRVVALPEEGGFFAFNLGPER